MVKILNYKILGTALKSLSDACFKADEQQRNGETIAIIKGEKSLLISIRIVSYILHQAANPARLFYLFTFYLFTFWLFYLFTFLLFYLSMSHVSRSLFVPLLTRKPGA